jgi:hypothetical protein
MMLACPLASSKFSGAHLFPLAAHLQCNDGIHSDKRQRTNTPKKRVIGLHACWLQPQQPCEPIPSSSANSCSKTSTVRWC